MIVSVWSAVSVILTSSLTRALPFCERLADEVIGQLDLELGVAVGVGLAVDGLEVLEGHVEGAGRHLDLAAGHRLAEEVVDLQIDRDRFLSAGRTSCRPSRRP